MGSKSGDWVAAEPAFSQIGDNWEPNVGKTEAWFKQNRDWATQLAPVQAKACAFRQEAEANRKSPEGQAYRAEFDPTFAAFEQSCVSEANGDSSKFQLFVQVGKDGSAENAHTEGQASPMAMCNMKALYLSYVRKEAPFPPPPKGHTYDAGCGSNEFERGREIDCRLLGYLARLGWAILGRLRFNRA